MMTDPAAQASILQITASIVAAHVSNNPVPVGELPNLIKSVYSVLTQQGQDAAEPVAESPEPAVPIRKSVHRDYIVCLEDGRKLKMLKRHLRNAYGLTPEQYRTRWGLPPNYPMVAPAYAERRSALAKEIGLGTGRVGPKRKGK